MEKVYTVGNRTMDKEQYDKFVSLSHKEQVNLIYSGLSPKDMDVAEQALKNVPNGDNIGKSGKTEAVSDNKANDSTGGSKVSSKGSKSSPEES